MECYGNNETALPPMGVNLKMTSMPQIYWNAILLLAALALAKVSGHSRLDSLEAKVNHFTDISSKIATLEETSNQTSGLRGSSAM